jgi:hypothetical protein
MDPKGNQHPEGIRGKVGIIIVRVGITTIIRARTTRIMINLVTMLVRERKKSGR